MRDSIHEYWAISYTLNNECVKLVSSSLKHVYSVQYNLEILNYAISCEIAFKELLYKQTIILFYSNANVLEIYILINRIIVHFCYFTRPH